MRISVGRFCLLILAFASLSTSIGALEVTYKWRFVNYTWSTDSQRQEAVESSLFNHSRIYIHDIQPLSDGRMLATLPKRFANNPASLVVVSEINSSDGPLMTPYPSWEHHMGENCTRIISINRIVLVGQNKVWGIDTGIIAGKQVCGAKLYSFDVGTNVVSESIEIPDSVSLGGTLEIYSVETRGSISTADSPTLYISDITKNGFIVWDGSTFFRRTHELFYGSPNDPVINVGGYDLDTDLYGRGLSMLVVPPRGIFNEDLILFKDLTATRGYFAARKQLVDPTVTKVDYYETDIKLTVNDIAAVSSAGGIKFTGIAEAMTLACWNMLNPFDLHYLHLWETDEENLQFISSLKIIQGQRGEEIWVISNRFTEFSAGAMNFEEFNFRILRGNVAEMIANTVCDPKFAVRPANVTTPGGIEDDAIHIGCHLFK